MSRFKFYTGVFLVTSSTLMFQLIETRILSVILWYHLAFFAISMAMFGLTAGAVWVYLRRERYTQKNLSYNLAYFSALFAITMILSLGMQLVLTLTVTFSITGIIVWILLASFMAVPYFFSGVTISLALTRSPYPIGRVYGVDLFGAAVGCLGVLVLLNLTDGPSAVIWAGAVAAAGAWFFAGSGIGGFPETRPPWARLVQLQGRIFLVLVILAIINGLTPYGLQPILVKDRIEGRGASVVEKWNSFSRVTIFRDSRIEAPQIWGPSPKLPRELLVERKYMEIDGFASTSMYRFRGDVSEAGYLKYDVTNLAYFLPNQQHAAIIGVGGGRDVLSAWVFGLRDITGIEINPTFIQLLTADPEFSKFAGLAQLKSVRFIVDEARNWFARTQETFDVIQMTLTDTEAATGAGAFTLSENGLYTVEAWKLFLSRLTPKGVFSVSRWYAPGQVNETGRVISLAAATLLDLGVKTPQRHIFVASTENIATLLLSPAPFSPKDIETLEKTTSAYQYQVILHPYSPPQSNVLQAIFRAKNIKEMEEHTRGFALDLKPPLDDRPFFFNQLPFYRPVEVFKMLLNGTPSGAMRGNLMAAATLLIILIVSLGLVLVTIVIPLRPALKDVGPKLVLTGTSYFFLIGVGFMTVEVSLLQRMSVFLGHPIYSLSVVLFSLILTTGFGSLISDRFPLDNRCKFMLWSGLTAIYLISLPFWLPKLLIAYDHANLLGRCVLCVTIITPAGLFMGFGFPTGMRLVSAVDPNPTPWFWGINGIAGVLAATTTVAISIAWGINSALVLGGFCYIFLIPAALGIGFPKRVGTVADI